MMFWWFIWFCCFRCLCCLCWFWWFVLIDLFLIDTDCWLLFVLVRCLRLDSVSVNLCFVALVYCVCFGVGFGCCILRLDCLWIGFVVIYNGVALECMICLVVFDWFELVVVVFDLFIVGLGWFELVGGLCVSLFWCLILLLLFACFF